MFSLEHSRAGYWADFVVYALIVGALAVAVATLAPASDRGALLPLAAAGWLAWSFIEYAIHRFVLHGIEPFKSWHARHHDQPTALISAPTALSATSIVALVFVPAWGAGSPWRAIALTLGVTAGYLFYALTHHAHHHWRAHTAWLRQRKRWHSIHHRSTAGECYGVTCALWDRVFGTAPVGELRKDGRWT